MNYYNENDKKAAMWLRHLIADGLIPNGKVDERSILDVTVQDLRGFTQHHFFAGVGGWSFALFLANWPAWRKIWTGSCPCQPFSHTGKGLGEADARHLWPAWFKLIEQFRPDTIVGEQVASKAALKWFDGVSSDLEGAGYSAAAFDLCSAGVGAPNIRQRLYWMAHSEGDGRVERGAEPSRRSVTGGCCAGRLADPLGVGRCSGEVQDPEGQARDEARLRLPSEAGRAGGMVDAQLKGLEGHARHEHRGNKSGRNVAPADGSAAATGRPSYWDAYDILLCTDGKARRVEPGSFPLAHGIPNRVGLLRGYGNGINPYVGKVFIEAVKETLLIL